MGVLVYEPSSRWAVMTRVGAASWRCPASTAAGAAAASAILVEVAATPASAADAEAAAGGAATVTVVLRPHSPSRRPHEEHPPVQGLSPDLARSGALGGNGSPGKEQPDDHELAHDAGFRDPDDPMLHRPLGLQLCGTACSTRPVAATQPVSASPIVDNPCSLFSRHFSDRDSSCTKAPCTSPHSSLS